MIDRCCRWCGFHFDASISYAGRKLPGPTFGRYRSWCSVPHRSKSYRVHRQRLHHQELLRRRYRELEILGQLRFFLDGEA